MEGHNSIRFFNDTSQTVFHLFIDAYSSRIGGFYYEGGLANWKAYTARIPSENAYSEPILLSKLTTPLNINIFKVQAVLIAL